MRKAIVRFARKADAACRISISGRDFECSPLTGTVFPEHSCRRTTDVMHGNGWSLRLSQNLNDTPSIKVPLAWLCIRRADSCVQNILNFD